MISLTRRRQIRCPSLTIKPIYMHGLDDVASGHARFASASVGPRGPRSGVDPRRVTDTAQLRCPRPVIAAVNGAAAGGGNELVVACDLAIAARSATFGQTGPRVGSAPVTGATNVMSVQIGEKRAKELSFLCRRYTAEQALEMGLVNKVVDDDDLDAQVRSWCAEITALSPRYLEIAKVSSNIWWNSARDSFTNGLGMLIQAIGSEDMVEGANAFLEKRPPKFELHE